MTKDALGDRMKSYEMAEAGRRVMLPRIPVLARFDGVRFSRFTEGLAKPYDDRMILLMTAVTKLLVKTYSANVGYTQSDEITLCWYTTDMRENVSPYGGRHQKMTSIMASYLTAQFNKRVAEFLPEKADSQAYFDCRVWNVPNMSEAVNTFLWREQDAVKNSISGAAQQYYKHSELQGKNTKEMQEMLFEMGVNWNDYPAAFKRGTYVQVRPFTRPYNAAELLALPEKHAARRDPNLVVTRNETVVVDMPRLSAIKNKADVLLFGATPELSARPEPEAV